MNKFYYEILEIKKDASQGELKKSYDRLVKKGQTDLSSGKIVNTIYLQELEKAYEVLSDPVRRMHYDAQLKIEREFGPLEPELEKEEKSILYDEEPENHINSLIKKIFKTKFILLLAGLIIIIYIVFNKILEQ